MFCPECGDEYRDGFNVCAECHVPLISARPAEAPHPDITLVTVLSGREESKLAVAKSLLTGARIPFVAKGVPLGHLGFITGTGPFEIQVSTEDREAAVDILGGLNGGA